VPIDDAAVLAVKHVADETGAPTPRSRPPTLPPSIDADIRLIRAAMDQQAQMLSVLHQMLVTNQAVVEARLQEFSTELNAQTVKIDTITEMLSAINKHLGVPIPG
jgi:hypothetical protein